MKNATKKYLISLLGSSPRHPENGITATFEHFFQENSITSGKTEGGFELSGTKLSNAEKDKAEVEPVLVCVIESTKWNFHQKIVVAGVFLFRLIELIAQSHKSNFFVDFSLVLFSIWLLGPTEFEAPLSFPGSNRIFPE